MTAFASEDDGRTSVEGLQIGGKHCKPPTAESANFIDSVSWVPVRTVHLLSPLIVWYNAPIIPQTAPWQVALDAFTLTARGREKALAGKHLLVETRGVRGVWGEVLGTTAVRVLALSDTPVIQPDDESHKAANDTANQALHGIRVTWNGRFGLSGDSNDG